MRKNVLYLLAVTLLISASCKKSDNPAPAPPAPDPVENIYVAGSSYINGKNTAVYWKDSTLITVGDLIHESFATGIYVSGSDVYICGTEYNGTTTEPKYWKNGTGQLLSQGHNANTVGIAVSGSDVYIAGHEKNDNGVWVSKYWKNGTAITLQENSYASDIKVVGGDVYISGTDLTAKRAVYWKNGQKVTLSEGDGSAASITIAGSDIYVAGRDVVNGTGSPVYWKNSVRTQFNPAGINSIYDLDFSDGNMYLTAALTDANSADYANFFKNGTANRFTVSDGTYNSECRDLFTLNGNVYATGMVNTVYKTVPSMVYWKNNKLVDLDKTLYGSKGNRIFVTVK